MVSVLSMVHVNTFTPLTSLLFTVSVTFAVWHYHSEQVSNINLCSFLLPLACSFKIIENLNFPRNYGAFTLSDSDKVPISDNITVHSHEAHSRIGIGQCTHSLVVHLHLQ